VNRNRFCGGVNTVHSLSGPPVWPSCTLPLPGPPSAAPAAFPFRAFRGPPAAIRPVTFVAAEVRTATAPRLRDDVQAQARDGAAPPG
jgi:hypothetical protein